MAQHPHWDQFPTSRAEGFEIIEDTLGSAIIALHPTKILVWAFSRLEGEDKFVVELMLPAGSALSFATPPRRIGTEPHGVRNGATGTVPG